MKCLQFLAVILFALILPWADGELQEVFRWKQIEYGNCTINSNQDSTSGNGGTNNSYIAYNNLPMGVTHHEGRLFISLPRRNPGIPATLNYINTDSSSSDQSPLFHAYPDFETNILALDHSPSPDRIISVYRTQVDACNRLWFVDTGVLEYPDSIQVQQPSIWVIDLATNQRLHRFEIPAKIVTNGNGLPSITVDVDADQCGQAFAYLPDLANYRLYVFSLEQNRIWSFSHNYFRCDPLHGDFDSAGVKWQWNDGVFSVALGPKDSRGFRTAYFHAMAAITSFNVSTEVLRNEKNAARSDHGEDFKFLGWRQDHTQTTSIDYDAKTGVIFYAEVGRNAIGCWNTKKPFTKENHDIVFRDNERMIYPSDLSVDRDGTLWVMSNTLPRFAYATLDPNEYNFRVWKETTENAIRGTLCAN